MLTKNKASAPILIFTMHESKKPGGIREGNGARGFVFNRVRPVI